MECVKRTKNFSFKTKGEKKRKKWCSESGEGGHHN